MEYAVAAAIVLLAATVRGATGFGFALIAAPAFAFLWEPLFATAVVLVLDLVATAMLLREGVLKEVYRRDALLLCSAGAVGAVFGTLVIKDLPAEPALIGLNLAVLVSAAVALLNIRMASLDTVPATLVAGFATGALIGAFAVGGTLVVAWLMAVNRTPAQCRALLTLLFALTDTLALLLRVVFGVLPGGTLMTAAALAPVMILGIFAGSLAFNRISATGWKRIVAVFLMVLACASLARSIAAI